MQWGRKIECNSEYNRNKWGFMNWQDETADGKLLESSVKLNSRDQGQGPRMKPS